MKRSVLHLALPGALCLGAAAPALADDPRVATRAYVADKVERFAARTGFQSTIAFAPAERIENVAVGDSAAWQITPNRAANLLFVKPASAAAPLTNMTVVTDRRTYLFELRLDQRAAPLYLLRFTYPVEAEGTAQAAPAVIAAAETVVTPPALPVETMNFAWTMRGEKRVLPERVFDDGSAVFLEWPADRPLPAVLTPAPEGKGESPVNFTARGAFLVVEGRPDRLVLRSGRDVAYVEAAPRQPGQPASPATPTIAAR